MDTTDFLRYSRQMNLTEVGVEGQMKIKQAKVLVIGAGGLGSPVLTYLSSCGVGTLAVVDFDTIEQHNLHRQILFTEEDINQNKTAVAYQRIKQINPHINFTVYNQKLNTNNAEQILRHYDIIVDGSDNFSTRYLVNDTCVLLNKTLVSGTIFGFEGQISVFNHKGSPNLRNLFPEPPAVEDVPNCNLNGVLGTFPGIIGTIVAHETLKAILELPTLSGQLLILNTLTWEINKLRYT
ncbi:HesA/MoeB/ThiF family protein [Myroides marinus]|uniref:Molybdopterin-synthase adenylyltransferase n=1 Tax=Myroides marinus TaxID=703342 RepID=A0A1H6RFL9_9FLAO|nr:HesA/MoeB/ThiF family protein [Myroides marinus]MDM1345514.1 HesA/MoeB/ThiF family protein [Myroides marinus]MDM1349103.1 HesA/MoeB/ThiF family protein [Myroides marinus]MDM1352749.1 HesA/MoeB/ThiF family protein [Myroides marinus]MDM1356313.1 HesA/MoeB/ThiF family protein [Myroides marinus]MDM1363454.1 HesA/MoeB/ThiF family protein [Myroides marinus]